MTNIKKPYAEQLQEWRQRNFEIYALWKSGKKFVTISKIYRLTSGRIAQICHKQQRAERRKQNEQHFER